MKQLLIFPSTSREAAAHVHCTSCARDVAATVVVTAKSVHAKPGQHCPRCQSGLDAAFVIWRRKAA